MATKSKIGHVRPSDLPTETVLLADGSTVKKKVIQVNSPTFAEDVLAAFQWNVRRIRAEQRRQRKAADGVAHS